MKKLLAVLGMALLAAVAVLLVLFITHRPDAEGGNLFITGLKALSAAVVAACGIGIKQCWVFLWRSSAS